MNDPEELLHALRHAGREYATSKATHDYLEHYRRHVIANLMKDAEARGVKTASAQEREAYSSAVYADHLGAIREAQVAAANASAALREAEMAIEIWRTKCANLRLERKAYNA
jgi:hypothetical protein